MSVYIAHSAHDENGNARGGEPGDQTGKEVCTRRWYLNTKGWRVFRPKDTTVAEKIARDAEAAAANPFIGYDQGDRLTLLEESKRYDYNCAAVTTPCECDCSSLVSVCCLYAGVKVGNFNTESEPGALLRSGAFIELEGAEYTDSPDRLRRGDILVTRVKGHTAVVINNGKDAEPFPDPTPDPEPTPDLRKYVRIKGGSVRVRVGDNTGTRTIGIVHRGDDYPLVGYGESGWYEIAWHGSTGYVSNKPQYTEVIDHA